MDPTPAQPAQISKGPILLVLALTVLVFGASIGAPFHLDDVTLSSEPVVTAPSGWWYVWRPLQTRPLTYLTFWLNWQLGGDNPIGYHASNVGLHVLAVWLLHRLVARFAGDHAALIAAVLFALHPIQTEPVVYVFERATLLAAVFCLLSAHAWLDGNFPRSIGFFIFALLSKEECVAFPVLLLLLRPVIMPALIMLGLSLAAGIRVILALHLLHITGAGMKAGISPFDYFRTQASVILRYFRLFFLPYGFTCDPDPPIVRDWHAWLAILSAAVILWRFHPHGKWFAAGLILLAPSSTIFPAEDLAADRRMYLPMIAFAAFAGLLLRRVPLRPLLVPLALCLASLSALRVQVWRSEYAIWDEAVQRSPKKVRPRVLLSRLSEHDAAMRMLNEAHAAAPRDPRPLVEKGLRLIAANRPDSALPEFERALLLAPDDPVSLNNYGAALAVAGRKEAAIEQFRHALRIEPCSADARKNLALLGAAFTAACR